MNLTIRLATEDDAQEILSIYAPYVRETAITFEYEVPALEEFRGRIRETLLRYPYLVALEDGRIVGYAYASAFKKRAAYDWAVEMSIYLRMECRGKGIGKTLYTALEETLRRQHVQNLNAGIASIGVQDEHVDDASERFHERMGYRKTAHFTKCGYKFGTWYDVIWMEKMLGDHPCPPEPFLPITEIQIPADLLSKP